MPHIFNLNCFDFKKTLDNIEKLTVIGDHLMEPFQFTLLLVEDDVELLRMLSDEIKRKGVKVFTASNGLNALEVIKSNQIDVVVSDLEMPEMDGIGLRKLVTKMISVLPRVWLGFSGAAKVDLEALKGIGFDEILFKPLSSQMLLNTCAGLLKSEKF
jgi:CheY-like chemotaxis protein